MSDLFFVFIFVLPSVGIGLGVGIYLGRTMYADKHTDRLNKERQETLKGLVTLLESAAQLTADVDSHNHEMTEMKRHVGELHSDGQFENVQNALLGHIAAVVDANRRLEDDLTTTRFRMEQQAQELDKSRSEARTDALSGIGNRMAFDETLNFLLAAWNRERKPFVLVLADIDHFKWINDTHGHPAGDRIVANVGKHLHEHVRGGDYVCRFGGDEFAILLTKVDINVGRMVTERLWQGISRTNFDAMQRDERVAVTFSMGLAAVREGDTATSVLARADEMLYRAKQGGRNQLQCEAGAPPVHSPGAAKPESVAAPQDATDLNSECVPV